MCDATVAMAVVGGAMQFYSAKQQKKAQEHQARIQAERERQQQAFYQQQQAEMDKQFTAMQQKNAADKNKQQQAGPAPSGLGSTQNRRKKAGVASLKVRRRKPSTTGVNTGSGGSGLAMPGG